MSFWKENLNPITMFETSQINRKGPNAYNGYYGAKPYVREGINQHFYAHNRTFVNPVILDTVKDFGSTYRGGGEVKPKHPYGKDVVFRSIPKRYEWTQREPIKKP